MAILCTRVRYSSNWRITLIALGAIGIALALIYLGLKENGGSNGGNGAGGSGDPLGDILNDY